jgi:Tfp pilus assembly protein PilX
MTARASQLRLTLRPRGVALVMVITVIAVATVLGYVMLSSASLQQHAGANQTKLLSADYLAESGLNIAMYYLQYPEQAPALNPDGYWAGMNASYTLPNGSPGSLSVVVTRDPDDKWTYEVVASASVGSATVAAHRVSRATGARVFVQSEYVMKPGAIVANNSITLSGPITTFGDVYSPKTMLVRTGSVVNGNGYAQPPFQTISPYTQPSKGYKSITNTAPGAAIAPANTDVNRYKTYKAADGETHSADLLSAVTSLLGGLLGIITRQPTVENPGGVMYKEGTYELQDNVTINGTLVVEGDLLIKGTNISINPQPGFPALVVTGNVEIYQQGKSLTSNGVTYIGGQLKSNGSPLLPALASTFTVNGGLIFGSPTVQPIMTGYNVKTSLTYNAAKASAPELSSALRTTKGVTIVRWGLP